VRDAVLTGPGPLQILKTVSGKQADARSPASHRAGRELSPEAWLEEPSLALRERIAGAPARGHVKGWLVHSIIENAKRHGVTLAVERSYLGFKEYPIREYLQLLAQAAVRVEHGRPPVDTLRELGRGVYGAFTSSMVGKVVRAGLGDGRAGARSGVGFIARIYRMTSDHTAVECETSADDVTTVRLSNVWSFPEAYHLGIFEGAARAFGGDVTAEVSDVTLSSATLTFRWKD
jgi:uncharacterized protein (TIGR02265 family)